MIVEKNNQFTKSFCDNVIDKASKEFSSAGVLNGSDAETTANDFRNNTRAIIHPDALLFGTVKSALAGVLGKQVDINPVFRVYRYEEGQYFKAHKDNEITTDCGGTTTHTVLIYLNDNFIGGETITYPTGLKHKDFAKSIKPSTGKILVFDQNLLHEGVQVKLGVKYVLRTDIISYERKD